MPSGCRKPYRKLAPCTTCIRGSLVSDRNPDARVIVCGMICVFGVECYVSILDYKIRGSGVSEHRNRFSGRIVGLDRLLHSTTAVGCSLKHIVVCCCGRPCVCGDLGLSCIKSCCKVGRVPQHTTYLERLVERASTQIPYVPGRHIDRVVVVCNKRGRSLPILLDERLDTGRHKIRLRRLVQEYRKHSPGRRIAVADILEIILR